MKHTVSEREVAGLTWDRVKARLQAGATAILPIGAGAKEHGLHMPMATDQIFAEYFSRALAERIDALIWPALTYGFYPAFTAYAGSVSLSRKVFAVTVREVADALLAFGAIRVLVLDTGLSTIEPVEAAIGVSRDPSRVTSRCLPDRASKALCERSGSSLMAAMPTRWRPRSCWRLRRILST